jgi:hypothetical protein
MEVDMAHERLVYSLFEAYHDLFKAFCALSNAVQSLHAPHSAIGGTTAARRSDLDVQDTSIHQKRFADYYDEEQKHCYELQDERYQNLVLQDAQIRRALRNPAHANQHDLLFSKQSAIHQEMTDILTSGESSWEDT